MNKINTPKNRIKITHPIYMASVEVDHLDAADC